MARPTKSERHSRVHTEALEQFERIQGACRDERLQCLEDRRFATIAGGQWEGPWGEQFANRPKIEVNKIHLAVLRIINEYRNNRITVDFIAKDGEDDDLAETCDGLYRADEQDSAAEEAYDNAFEEAVTGGFGAWRLRTVYEDEEDDDSDDQRIRIEPIYDADSAVFFDPNARRADKADAQYAFVLVPMTREAYRAEYDDDPSSWPNGLAQYQFDWATTDTVFVAEYYRVEMTSDVIRKYRTIDGREEKYTALDFETDDGLEDRLAAVGTTLEREKRVKRKRVRKYILSGGGILEDHGYIAGKHIPIVPVYGKRWYVDGIERCMGQVRLAKDSQRLKNMQLSRLAEISALSPIEKPIFTPEQMTGHEYAWAEDGVKNHPYLLVNPLTGPDGMEQASGPLGYTKPPAVPPAMAALLQITEQDMADVLGRQEAGEELNPGMSGRAVELIQNRLDMQSYIYMSNMAKAVRRCGEIWLSIAREVYVGDGRKMRTLETDGSIGGVELNRPMQDVETGEVYYENDLSRASYDVAVEVGPTSSSRRAATVQALTGMMQVAPDPETQMVLASMAMMNMEGEGLGDVRDWFRKRLLRMGVVQPTEQEAQELAAEAQAQQPDPQAQLAQSLAMEAQAKALRAQADTEKAVAVTQKTRAETIETLAGIDRAGREQAVNTAEKLFSMAAEATPQPPGG